METEELETKPVTSKFGHLGWLPLALLFMGIFILALGVGLNFLGKNDSGDVKIISAIDSETSEKIIVHVDGAVNKPGIYELANNARMNDAIIASGGLTDNADPALINLAAKVIDGQKIYIQKVGEPVSAKAATSVGQLTSATSLININSATDLELDKLPGIGSVTAAKIINGRPYKSIDELINRKIVGKSVYEKIKDSIGVN